MGVLDRAIEFYGIGPQVDKCKEELIELIDAITKYQDGRDTLEHVAEEIADVEITIEQVKIIYGIFLNVDFWKKKKLRRLEERIYEGLEKRLDNVGDKNSNRQS